MYMYMYYMLYCLSMLSICHRMEAQSKTLPASPKMHVKAAAEEKDKKKSKNASADGDSSPKHPSALAKLFRRKEKGRSHSIQEYDIKQREEKKSGKKGAKISFPLKSKDTLSVVSRYRCKIAAVFVVLGVWFSMKSVCSCICTFSILGVLANQTIL